MPRRHVHHKRNLGVAAPAAQDVRRCHRVQDLPQAGLVIAAEQNKDVGKTSRRAATLSYFLLGLEALPERHMVDNVAVVTNYQRQRRGRALAE